jgi:hypothetical protein
MQQCYESALSSQGSQLSSGRSVFGAGGPLLSAVSGKGAEMGSLEAFFIVWSVAIIALLTLLGINVIRIWMLDRRLSKRSRLPLIKL